MPYSQIQHDLLSNYDSCVIATLQNHNSKVAAFPDVRSFSFSQFVSKQNEIMYQGWIQEGGCFLASRTPFSHSNINLDSRVRCRETNHCIFCVLMQ